jgi:hypothetical protein
MPAVDGPRYQSPVADRLPQWSSLKRNFEFSAAIRAGGLDQVGNLSGAFVLTTSQIIPANPSSVRFPEVPAVLSAADRHSLYLLPGFGKQESAGREPRKRPSCLPCSPEFRSAGFAAKSPGCLKSQAFSEMVKVLVPVGAVQHPPLDLVKRALFRFEAPRRQVCRSHNTSCVSASTPDRNWQTSREQGPFKIDRESSFTGGPGRTRTCNQTVMSGRL